MVEIRHQKLSQIEQQKIERARHDRDLAMKKKMQRIAKASQDGDDMKVTSTPVMNCYINQAKLHNMDVPTWGRREMNMAKTFIQRCGSTEKAVKVVEYIFTNWPMLVKKWKIIGIPTIGIILKFGIGLVNEVRTTASGSKPKINWKAETVMVGRNDNG